VSYPRLLGVDLLHEPPVPVQEPRLTAGVPDEEDVDDAALCGQLPDVGAPPAGEVRLGRRRHVVAELRVTVPLLLPLSELLARPVEQLVPAAAAHGRPRSSSWSASLNSVSASRSWLAISSLSSSGGRTKPTRTPECSAASRAARTMRMTSSRYGPGL